MVDTLYVDFLMDKNGNHSGLASNIMLLLTKNSWVMMRLSHNVYYPPKQVRAKRGILYVAKVKALLY